MPYALLAAAILVEVGATSMMKSTDGFTRPLPTAAVLLGYALSFVLLAQVVKDVSISVAYAIWAGAGTALVAAVGVTVLGEPATALKLTGIALVIGGVVLLNLQGAH